MQENEVRDELIRLLDYYKKQLQNGECTLNAMLTFYKLMTENLNVVGTAKDFAEFYGVSEDSVRHVINRYMVQKPTRRVFYPFHPFTKIIPHKWLKNK